LRVAGAAGFELLDFLTPELLEFGMSDPVWQTKVFRWPAVEGSPIPLGPCYIPEENAFNFALYSKNATSVTLLLYTEKDLAVPALSIALEPLSNKTKRTWHCRLPESELKDTKYFAYQVNGPAPVGPYEWHAFDPEKVLLDPFAKGIFFPPQFSRESAKQRGSNAGRAPLGLFRSIHGHYYWKAHPAPRHFSHAIIYELHVRGFTASPTSGVDQAKRGTFLGLIDKIPYLKELGVTIVELMPVQQFDHQEGNYWGYMTLNFFAPHQGYTCAQGNPVDEFRQMVDALHAADIEVVLDVVYNHTAESDHAGPTYSFKGIDNASFYLMSPDPNRPYADFSGTGNTLNVSDPSIRSMVLNSLRYWVTEMHVDGFRFDLASILTRKEDGSIDLIDPPLLSAMRTDPVLSHVRLIAEPWDAAGAYQLGTTFPGMFWHQWNGQFRDDVRRFVRGDPGMVTAVMRRLYGSDDLFPDRLEEARRPFYSINYIISHDGFTLYDLVSYNERHNLANGHNNTDGTAENYSWNCGSEGDNELSDAVRQLRERQARNFFCLLLLANGIPMFLAGDEFLQTQQGNNNPYNQDNETTWLNWDKLSENSAFFRFVKLMISFRKAHPTLCRSRFWRDEIRWHGTGHAIDFSYQSKAFAYCLKGDSLGDNDLYVMINASAESLEFTICDGQNRAWSRVVDTAKPSPDDILTPDKLAPLSNPNYRVDARSVVVLMQ
jgi:isoamylase